MAPSLHRILARRLLTGGLLIAGLLGGLVLIADFERIDDAVVEMAKAEATRIAPDLPNDLDALDATAREILDVQLEGSIADRSTQAAHFVVAELYDMNRLSVADGVIPGEGDIEKAAEKWRHRFPPPGETRYAKLLKAGQLYIQVISPLQAADGRQIGWFEGVFHLPWANLAAAAGTGLRASLLVMVAVLLTTALLYPLIASLSRGMLSRSQALLDANLGTLEALGGAIAKRDSDTSSHNYRVTLYAVRLAEAIGLPACEMRALIKGAFLHDLGKLAISDAILLKPGRLTTDEFMEMKTHVAHGLDLLCHTEWLSDAGAVVGSHHEKFDGSGYPRGLTGEAIPLAARIFAIADVFDALTSKRPYKEAFPLADAEAILAHGRGGHFDPALVDAFLNISSALHSHLAGRTDSGIEDELHAVTRLYFHETVTG